MSTMGVDDTGYYSLREILGYNCKVNIVLSDRGRGKQEGEFMCLYRNVSDVDSAVGTWLDTLYENGYHPEQFEWNRGKGSYELLYNGAVKGYFRALSQVNHIKQEKFPDTLNWIWMDEFIPLVYKKLAGVDSEGDAIRAIMKTVEHDTAHSRESKGLKPLRVLMYANPFTWNNPILSYFRVRPFGYGIRRIGPDIVCEMLAPYEAENKWKDMIPEGSIRIKTGYYGIYHKESNRRLYVKEMDGHLDVGYRYGSLDGLQEQELCLDKLPFLKRLQQMSYSGNVWYYDINTKFDWLRDITE